MKRPGTRGSEPAMPEGVDPDRVSASKGGADIPEHIIEAGSSMLLWLSDEHVEVVPGQPARLRVNVRNISAVVQTFSLHAIGPASQWTAILPGQISLFPGEEGSASVVVRAQKSPTLPAGHYIVGIMARSEVDHADSVVGEFDVTVRPYHQFKAALSRPTVDMRRKATMFLQITNDGNSPVTYQVQAADPEGRLVAKLSHDKVVLPPGDPTWIKVQIKAPVHLIGAPVTHGLIVTTTAARDETTGSDLSDVQPSVQRSTIIQRPLFHFRLGFFGRMALLLALLGLVATFLIPRLINAFLPRTVTGAPLVPASFVAGLDPDQQVLLTWNPSSGATSYSIYAVGNTGNPVPTPSPSAATVTATATVTIAPTTAMASVSVGTDTMPPSVAGLVPSSDATVLRRAAPADKRTASAAPATLSPTATVTGTAPSTSPAAELATLPVPLCDDCSHVADVPGGTTRYVVTTAPPGITACYRIVAIAGSSQSMFSPQACVTTPGTAGGGSSPGASGSGLPTSTDAGGSGMPINPTGSTTDGGGAGKETPGKESLPPTTSPSGTAPTTTGSPSGTSTTAALPPCPPLNPSATALSASAVVAMWTVISPSASDSGCNPRATLTGFQIDQQVGTGWTTLTGGPTAQDTAYQITGLGGSIQYCFRMRAVAGSLVSSNTAAFCATTLPSTALPSTSTSATATASPSPSVSASASATKAARALNLPGVVAPELGVPDTLSRVNGNLSGQSLGNGSNTAHSATDMVAMRVAVRQAEREARSARVAADEAGLQAIALSHGAQLQMIAAEQARAQVGALANALYREGEVGALVEAVLTLGMPRQSSVLVGASYVSAGSMSASALLRAQQQAEDNAVRAANAASTALRSAEVLQGLARQQLSGLQALLRQAILNRVARGPQTVVGADGCPVNAPGATLRGGAQELGINELCRLSVAEAPTPQAALAIKYALGQLGAPYACRGVGRLDPFRFDCSSFVARAYADGAGVPLTREGWAPSTRNMVPWDGIALDRHYALLSPKDLAPGDLVLYDTGGATYRHVVMVLANGYMVHTNACGDVLHVDRFWGTDAATKGQFLVARRVLLEPDYSLAPGDPATGEIPQPISPTIPSDQEAGDTRA